MDLKPRFPLRRFASLDAMKAEEYRYWQSQPAPKRMDAVAEISREAYGLADKAGDAFRLQRTLVRLKR